MRTRSIAAAIAVTALLAAFAASTASAEEANSISILIHPCAFGLLAQDEFGTWETTGAVTDSGTYVRTRVQAFPPNAPPFTPGVRIIENFLLTSGSGTLDIVVRQVTGVPNGRWRTTEGTGAYEDAEWHGTGVTLTFVQPVSSCQSTFALTGVTKTDDREEARAADT